MCHTAHSFHTVGYTIGYILLDTPPCWVYTPHTTHTAYNARRGGATVATEGLLTTGDVAGLLNVSARQVQDMAAKKELPAYRVGGPKRGQWRFRRDEIETWLVQQRNGPGESEQT